MRRQNIDIRIQHGQVNTSMRPIFWLWVSRRISSISYRPGKTKLSECSLGQSWLPVSISNFIHLSRYAGEKRRSSI